jgi:ectoine hydroxylase-related dioxygenase (phytanoyl-CoA dioxygenase family)
MTEEKQVLTQAIEVHGFAAVEGVLEPREVVRMLADMASFRLPRSRAGVRHAMQHTSVAALARDSRLLGLVRSVLGPAAVPFRATLFDKSPSANWLVVWHQDTALPLRHRQEAPGWGPWSRKAGVVYAHAPTSALSRILALRVHLDDSTGHNGPLRVLPGTHQRGVLTDEDVQQLAREVSPVDCVVSRGGVLAMRPLLIHSSSKSRVETPRRVLHIEYTVSMDPGDGLELAVA